MKTLRQGEPASACRLIVIMLCLFAAPILCGQNPATGARTTYTGPPTVPSLFGLNPNEVGQILESLRLQPTFSGLENGLVVAQEPAAGTRVPLGSVIAVTLGVLPSLVLTGPDLPVYADRDLTFTATFSPPLPAEVKATYTFLWDDGTSNVAMDSAVTTHRFSEGAHPSVSVVGIIDDRFKVGSNTISFDVVATPPPPPPPLDTTPQTTSTEVPTVTTSASGQTTGAGGTAGGTDPSSTVLLLIGAALIIVALVVYALLRKPEPEAQVQAKLPLAIKGRIGSIEYEIQRPEEIRRGPTVRLCGGIRIDAAGEGGARD